MAPLPTESRIFADRYMRALRKSEIDFANRVSPGATNRNDAVLGFFDRVRKSGSPIKRALLIKNMATYLNDTVTEGAHFILDCVGGSRSAGLMFATVSYGENPFLGTDEEGVCISKHMILSRRNGSMKTLPDVTVAFISKHAIGRLHERGHNLDNQQATCVLGCLGILGFLTRDSKKHVDGGLSLIYGDTLIVGSLRHAVRTIGKGIDINGTVFDVRTALPRDGVNNPETIEQANKAGRAIAQWLENRTIDRNEINDLAETIPYLPARDDYTINNAVRDQRSNPS